MPPVDRLSKLPGPIHPPPSAKARHDACTALVLLGLLKLQAGYKFGDGILDEMRANQTATHNNAASWWLLAAIGRCASRAADRLGGIAAKV